jgi:molybdate transport system substrate-binding protein
MPRKHYAGRSISALAIIAAALGLLVLPVMAQAPTQATLLQAAGIAAPIPRAPGKGTNVTLTVFAAASLTDVFKELGRNFERYNPGVKVVFNFAPSQLLSQQLNQGAPADVFASANTAQMNVAITGGRVSTSQVFVRNRLVVIYPANNPGEIKELRDLAKPGLQLVLAAQAVPVGQYALDFLDKATADPVYSASFKSEVLKNAVSYENNVKAVLAKVALGEADAGIVYTTDVLGSDALKVKRLFIPDQLNTVAAYPIAVVDDTVNAYWASGFVRYVLSTDGQLILWKYGFITNYLPTRKR